MNEIQMSHMGLIYIPEGNFQATYIKSLCRMPAVTSQLRFLNLWLALNKELLILREAINWEIHSLLSAYIRILLHVTVLKEVTTLWMVAFIVIYLHLPWPLVVIFNLKKKRKSEAVISVFKYLKRFLEADLNGCLHRTDQDWGGIF